MNDGCGPPLDTRRVLSLPQAASASAGLYEGTLD